MRNIRDIIKENNIFCISFDGMPIDLTELPFIIKEIGKDFIYIETLYELTELTADEDASEEDIENYINENEDLLSESSILVKREFFVLLDKINFLAPYHDKEGLDIFAKHRERFEATHQIRKMFEGDTSE